MPIGPTRKNHHLAGDLYQQPGVYFITICTANHQNMFWEPLICNDLSAIPLNHRGTVAKQCIEAIAVHYGNNVCAKKYVVMPNHVHLLLSVQSCEGRTCPDVRQVVRQFKAAVSHEIGQSVWQKGYYDRIVRDEAEYLEVWKYIDENPIKWNLDQYYTP